MPFYLSLCFLVLASWEPASIWFIGDGGTVYENASSGVCGLRLFLTRNKFGPWVFFGAGLGAMGISFCGYTISMRTRLAYARFSGPYCLFGRLFKDLYWTRTRV